MGLTEINHQQFTIKPANEFHEREIKIFLKENWENVKFSTKLIKIGLLSSMDMFWEHPEFYFQIMEVDKTIKATISFCPLHLAKGTDICFLKNFYVDKDLRGMGIGKLMLHKCLEKADKVGYRLAYLETKNTFESAISLYEKCGFKQLPDPLIKTHYPSDVFMLSSIRQVICNYLYE